MTNFSVKNYVSECLKNLCLNIVSLNFFSEQVVFKLKNSVSVRDSFFE